MNALHNIEYGLFVLTAKRKIMNGCIINTLLQVSSSPLKISIAINKNNYTTKIIQETGIFNVSILDKSVTFDLIKNFGFSSGKDSNKFINFNDYKIAQNGVPYITKSTNAYISAKVDKVVDVGSHFIFIADVVSSEVLSNIESVTYSYYLSNIKPKIQIKDKSVYVCRICGYVYEGDNLPEDFICPICKHGAVDFDKKELSQDERIVKNENKDNMKDEKRNTYVCPICGYEEESMTKPQSCVLCGSEMILKN